MFADGQHKLVRWGFVTHGGIDGYSRLVVYLHCFAQAQYMTYFFQPFDNIHYNQEYAKIMAAKII